MVTLVIGRNILRATASIGGQFVLRRSILRAAASIGGRIRPRTKYGGFLWFLDAALGLWGTSLQGILEGEQPIQLCEAAMVPLSLMQWPRRFRGRRVDFAKRHGFELVEMRQPSDEWSPSWRELWSYAAQASA